MNDHSIISPSSAGIWGKPGGCTGYVSMSAAYPELEDSTASAEGTTSHEIGEELIAWAMRVVPATVSASARETFVGKKASNGVIVTDEMFDAAWEYADDVVREARDRKSSPELEYRIKAPYIHAESFGTVDSWMYDPDKKELIVWDYKYGFGIVEAFENWQAINYVSGLLDELITDWRLKPATTIRIRIAQPRAFHRDGTIREWCTNTDEIQGYIEVLHNNAHIALSAEATTHTGDHCRYCEALHACPAALKAGVNLFEVTGHPLPVELTPQNMGVQLSIIRRAKKQLEYLESAFEEQVKSSIRSGKNVPGWSVQSSYGRLAWAKPIDEVIALGDMMGQDLRKPLDAITPTQAKKLGIDEALISAYSEKPNTGLKLTPDNKTKAREVFSS